MPTARGPALPPTMCCLVVDRILKLVSEAGFFARVYVDDVIIVIIADGQGVTSDLMKSALTIAEKWCGEVQLTVNLKKAKAVLFTRKYKASYSRRSTWEMYLTPN